MFEQAINRLLSGAVICRHTDRDSFEFLSQEIQLEEANRYLARIGKVIRSTSQGGTFFLVHADPTAAPRSEVQSLHRKILAEMRPVLGFVDLCMSASSSDAALHPGDIINAATIVAVIDADNKLRSDLQELVAQMPRATGTTTRERFDCVLTRLIYWDYLTLENAEREIYRATGKIDLFHDYLAFFIEHTPGAQEFVEAQDEQGELF